MLPSAISVSDLDEIAGGAAGDLAALRGASLLLTGATGFFGAWLVSAFAHARRRGVLDARLTILTRDADRVRARYGSLVADAKAELLAGDVRDFETNGASFTHVIHGATTSGAAVDPLEMFDVIAQGTRRVLDVAAESGCMRFLFVSSGAVYGAQPSEMTHVPESFTGGPDVLDPRSAYAEGKRAAELHTMLAAKKHGFDAVSARGFAFVGPYLPLDAHFAIGNFIRDALAGGPISILGDGTPYRSYMYGTDLVVWLLAMLVRGESGAAYNLGSDDGRPLRDIADRVAVATGTNVTVAKTAPPGHRPARYVPDTKKAREGLGVALRVDLDEAIRRTFAAHRGPS